MATTDKTGAWRKRLAAERGHKCEVCGAPGLLEWHHVQHRQHVGEHSPDNLRLLCMVCHKLAHGHKPRKLVTDPTWIRWRWTGPPYIIDHKAEAEFMQTYARRQEDGLVPLV